MKAFTLIIGLAMLVAACDSSSAIDGSSVDSSTFESSTQSVFTSEDIALMASDLGVTSSDLAALSAVSPDTRNLWALAAELHATLSDEQRARLLERLEQMGADRRAAGERAGRPGQAGQHGQRPGGQRPGGQRPGGFVPGQGGQPGAGRGDALAALDLTAEQEEALAAIREDFRAQMQALPADRDARREAMTALRDDMHAAILGVLTVEQAAQLEEHRAEAEAEREARQAERQAEREARRAENKAARAEALGLTDAQIAALDDLEAAREAFREEMQALRDAGTPIEEIRAAMDVHRQAQRDAMEQILTEEQLEITGIHRVLTLRMAARRAQGGPGRRGQN